MPPINDVNIQDNFSNGSAFHYRSKLLPLMLEFRLQSSHSPAASYKESMVLAREEWENILLNAIFTEPGDQTPWWYHRFIVSWIKPLSNSKNNEINNNSDGNDDDDDSTDTFRMIIDDIVEEIQEKKAKLEQLVSDESDMTKTPLKSNVTPTSHRQGQMDEAM